MGSGTKPHSPPQLYRSSSFFTNLYKPRPLFTHIYKNDENKDDQPIMFVASLEIIFDNNNNPIDVCQTYMLARKQMCC